MKYLAKIPLIVTTTMIAFAFPSITLAWNQNDGSEGQEQPTPTIQTLNLNQDELLNPIQINSSGDEYLAVYEDIRSKVDETISDKNKARKDAVRSIIIDLKKRAFQEAAQKLNQEIEQPLDPTQFNQVVNRASNNYQRFITEWRITKQLVETPYASSSAPEMVQVSAFFKIDNNALWKILAKTQTLNLDKDELLSPTQPNSSDDEYLAIYENIRSKVDKTILDKNKARKDAVRSIIIDLKKRAFQEAAEKVNQEVAQPMDTIQFNQVVNRASNNYQPFINDWKITKQLVEPQSASSSAPEVVQVSAFFKINKVALKKILISEGGITAVAKYRTYVELFWNVQDKDIHPEVIATVIGNVEDQFRQAGYEVVEFEKIKGDLVALLKKQGDNDADVYANDELTNFKANLELRNIDKKFVNGKRILADHADLLIGVTVNTIEVQNNELTVRMTSNATLVKQGQWLKLASSDYGKTAPHVRGSTANLIAIAKQVALAISEDLEPKVRKQLGQRKSVEKIQISQERDFLLIFKGIEIVPFNEIKTLLSKGSKWQFNGADFKARGIYLAYEGGIDGLVDLVQMYLEGAGITTGVGRTSTSRNRIIFSND